MEKVFCYPEFADSPVPIEIAAKVIGISPNTLRIKMENQVFDIGIVDRTISKGGHKGTRNCYVSPKKLWELTGYIWSQDKADQYRKGKETQNVDSCVDT